MANDFKDYVAEAQEQASPAERRAVDADRARFRIGTKVLQQRLSAGLTQQQLSGASGIAQADISRIERGQANPTADTLQALGSPLDVTLEFVAIDAAVSAMN
jgi:ribosome-binding protein aMBF1 (putative translation factor)